MNESELNPYRTPDLDHRGEPVDVLSETKFRRIISTIICTGAAFWCLFPAVACLDRLLPASRPSESHQPIPLVVLLLLTLIGIAAFFLGLCIRRNQKRYIFSLFMVILTMFLLFPLFAL